MSIRVMSWALEHAPVTDATALLVLLALSDRASDDGEAAFPSQEWLAKRARCSVRTVRRKLGELESAGVIRKGDPRLVAHIRQDRRPTVWNVCMGRANSGVQGGYFSSERPDSNVRADNLTGRTAVSYPPESGRTAVTERPDTGDRTTGHGCPTNRPEPSLTVLDLYRSNGANDVAYATSNDPGDDVTQDTPKATTYPNAFEDWWATYPRKVGKRKALAEWRRATKRITPDELNARTREFAIFHTTQETNPRYIPHPTTWLRRDGWEDELAPTPQKPASDGNTVNAWLGLPDNPNTIEGEIVPNWASKGELPW